MKETSAAKATRNDIILIQTTLADMTFEQFIHLSISEIRHLATLFEISKSDEQFVATFARHEVRRNRQHVCSPTKCERVKTFMRNDEAYIDWCCDRLRIRIDNCMFKVRQMLEGVNFDNTELSTVKMQAYQELYDVVSNSGESLVNRRMARAAARASKQ